MSATTTEGATNALRNAVLLTLRNVGHAVTSVKASQADAGNAEHITDAFLSAGALILALESLEDCAKEAARDAREVLRDAMADAGCYSLGGEAFGLALADAPRTVNITDRDALLKARPDLFSTPEPSPDRKAIADELRKGRAIEGAALGNGGPSILRINTKRTKQ
jgi:hypothetical protein